VHAYLWVRLSKVPKLRKCVTLPAAGIAYKGNTFGYEEARTTMATNFLGTADMCETLNPLFSQRARVVNVCRYGCSWLATPPSPVLHSRLGVMPAPLIQSHSRAMQDTCTFHPGLLCSALPLIVICIICTMMCSCMEVAVWN
jgi:hypothetical protein